MNNKTIGEKICKLRKDKGLTQSELAKKMNVTDKAVSKWERNIACPDINSIPKLAEIFGVSVDEILGDSNKKEDKESVSKNKVDEIFNIALIGVGLAMGVSTLVTSILNRIDINSAFTMISIGITCFGIYLLRNKSK